MTQGLIELAQSGGAQKAVGQCKTAPPEKEPSTVYSLTGARWLGYVPIKALGNDTSGGWDLKKS